MSSSLYSNSDRNSQNLEDYEMYLYFRENNDDKIKKSILKLDEQTSFEIIYDIYKDSRLYLLFKETTAVAPFYYNKSYSLEELYQNNKIFRACETLEEVKDNIISLFKQNKIGISGDINPVKNEEIKKGGFEKFIKLYKLNENTIKTIKMKINAVLFCSPREVIFNPYQVMIPTVEMEEKLCELYLLTKKKLSNLKVIYSILLGVKDKGKEQKDLIENLIALFQNYTIPGLEIEKIKSLKGEIQKEKKEKKEEGIEKDLSESIPPCSDFSKDEVSFQCVDLSEVYKFFTSTEVHTIGITLKNTGDRVWTCGTCLVCNKEKSTIFCEQAEEIIFEAGKDEDMDFKMSYEKKEAGEYVSVLNLKIEDKIYEDKEIKVNIEIKEKKTKENLEKFRKDLEDYRNIYPEHDNIKDSKILLALQKNNGDKKKANILLNNE